jgi:FMN phosphatase YigB (HAD superfamily)
MTDNHGEEEVCDDSSRYYRKVVVFDFDGTITNTNVVFPVRVEDAYNPRSLDAYIAQPLRTDSTAATRRALLQYKKEGLDAFVLATYNKQNVVLPVLRVIGLDDFFDAIVTADSYGARTAQEAYSKRVALEYKNGMIRLAIGAATPGEHVMLVDDSESNVMAASVVGMRTVHVGSSGLTADDVRTIVAFLRDDSGEIEEEEHHHHHHHREDEDDVDLGTPDEEDDKTKKKKKKKEKEKKQQPTCAIM